MGYVSSHVSSHLFSDSLSVHPLCPVTAAAPLSLCSHFSHDSWGSKGCKLKHVFFSDSLPGRSRSVPLLVCAVICSLSFSSAGASGERWDDKSELTERRGSRKVACQGGWRGGAHAKVNEGKEKRE